MRLPSASLCGEGALAKETGRSAHRVARMSLALMATLPVVDMPIPVHLVMPLLERFIEGESGNPPCWPEPETGRIAKNEP